MQSVLHITNTMLIYYGVLTGWLVVKMYRYFSQAVK